MRAVRAVRAVLLVKLALQPGKRSQLLWRGLRLHLKKKKSKMIKIKS